MEVGDQFYGILSASGNLTESPQPRPVARGVEISLAGMPASRKMPKAEAASFCDLKDANI